MKLIKSGDRYILECTYHERMVAKEAGFQWDFEKKQWYTTDINKAALLHSVADDEIKQAMEEHRAFQEASFEQSRASDADINIPVPDGLSYLPYQRAGIAYALGRKNTLIGDEMGLGKTIQAIGYINARPEISKVLIICPASLKINWKRECDKWLVNDYATGIAQPGGTFPTKVADQTIFIINYDILKRYENELRCTEWDLIVCDEAHYLKNERTLRAKQVFGYKPRGKVELEPIPRKHLLLLTGTPIANRPKELWPLVSNLDPDGWPNFFQYAKRYCNAHQNAYGWDFSGASNLEELQEKLRSTVMVRRMKTEVLTELPAKFRQVIEVEPDAPAKKAIDAELQEYDNAQARLAKLRSAVALAEANDDKEKHAEAVQRLKEALSADFEEMSRRRKEVGERKVKTVVDHIKEVLEEKDKVVVFAQHHSVIDSIWNQLAHYNPVKVDGRDSMEKRQESVDLFQNHNDYRIFIGQIQAAGVGLTLTRANHVIFAELDWVPGNISQAEDRCHRIGQQDNVLVQHIVMEGSLDARMAKTLVNKQNVIDQSLDDNITPETFNVETLLDAMETPQAPTKEKELSLDEIVMALSPHRIATIHQCIRMLSDMCDGARELDGAGFSAVDVEIGHSLASWHRLTPKQAALGLRLVTKYHRQLPESLVKTAKGEA